MRTKNFVALAMVVTASFPVSPIANAYEDCSGLKSQYDDAVSRVNSAKNAWIYSSDYTQYNQLKSNYDFELSR